VSRERLRAATVEQRLAEAEATIAALLSGEIDAVVDATTKTPMLLSKAQDALRISEERYRRIVETTNEGVWLIDAAGKTAFMNLRMARMLGCEDDMGLGRSPLEFLDDDGRAKLLAHRDQHRSEQAEVRYIRTDGTIVWGLLEATPSFDSAGRYEGTLAMVMDITARKQAEAALVASEARFRRLWESGIILITIVDAAGTIREVNDAGLQLLGYSREEILRGPLGWNDIIPAEWRPALEGARAQLASSGIASPWETEVVRKDGSRAFILAASAVIDDSERIAIGVDLTARRRAEDALDERVRMAALSSDVALVLTHEGAIDKLLERCAEALVEHLGIGFARIWTLDTKSKVLVLQANVGVKASVDRHLRVPVGQLSVGRIASTRQPSRVDDVSEEAGVDGPFFDGIHAFAGHPLLVDDVLVGVVAVFSRRRLSEAAFAALGAVADAIAVGVARNNVTRANELLEEQLRQAQKMEAVGRLAGGIAHDFNNILSVILTYCDFVLTDLKPIDPIRDDIGEIQKAGTRAANLTRQLLMFSRKQVLAPRLLDLDDVLSELENMLRRILGEDVELEIRRTSDLGRVGADPGSIEQVIMNLVVNARDAMPTGGKLTIATSNVTVDADFAQTQPGASAGPHVLLSVRDTGSGMDEATQQRMFEPFFTTKDVGKGTGLGLSTVFGIVQQTHGLIRATSVVGHGTTFDVYLPTSNQTTEARITQPIATRHGTETILLVEDEEEVRTVARAILKRLGYRVIVMRSAGEALLYCENAPRPIDLLVTDVVMPQMSGPELAQRLRVARPTLKFLCMSGYTDDSIVRHGVLEAKLAFIQKPFTMDSLGRKVREVLDG